MSWLFQALIALVVVGDYLMLSASRVLLGSNANWLLLVGIAQIAALVLAIGLGRARGLRMSIPLLGFVGLGVIMLVHVANRSISVGDFDDYGTTKVVGFFALSVPAFLLGSILGLHERMPGRRYFAWFLAPLLVMCVLALVTDSSMMTIRPSADLAVLLGVFVLPVHQALAFSLGKVALWLHTTLVMPPVAPDEPAPGRSRRLFVLGLIGFCLGMAVFSGSRGYLLAAGVALLAQWCCGRTRPGFVLLAAGVPFGLFLWLADDTIRGGLDPTVILNSASMYERMDLFAAAVEGFFESPLFGLGPGGFAVFHGYHERVYPHNLFLEILAELGLVGAACLALILVPVAMRAARACVRRELTEVQFFAIGFLVFSVIGAMGVADLIRNHFLFLAAGMTATACAVQPARAEDRQTAVRPLALG